MNSDLCFTGKLKKAGSMMKTYVVLLGLLLMPLLGVAQSAVDTNQPVTMKLNAGIVTPRIQETKAFYTDMLSFGITFENEFYLLMHTPNRQAEISFLLPNHFSQQPFFHKPFTGQGMYLTIEVNDVDRLYKELKQKGVPIKIDLRDEPWGDRHFAVEDPNGIGIDLVKYSPSQNK